ncbi:MAG: GIY-YIG nuclease family protein [Candidatus Atribacteria bacterium]|nr:GIY-YIG nuclease family protein [Candidatus Atribacteria bacterium]
MSTYLLFLNLPKMTNILVGKLGQFSFPAGQYIYIGRAKQNLKTRLERHQRKNKTLHWHIDYLLQYAKLEKIITYDGNDECDLARHLACQPGITLPIHKFGSSDCSCESHLFHLDGSHSSLDLLPGYTVFLL